MYKRKDNDIFGTANLGYAPRIENLSQLDPNAAFKKKMEENYDRYTSKLGTVPTSITGKPLDSTKVNERAQFEDDYHKSRKQADLQSSIFYEPTPRLTVKQPEDNSSLANSRLSSDTNFGRKETLKREIDSLPYNGNGQKGNCSRLFDMDQRVQPGNEQTPMIPLIPYQMQWDHHDSVRYAHINDHTHKPTEPKTLSSEHIEESKSTFFNQEEQTCDKHLLKKEETKTGKEEPKKGKEDNTLKKVKSAKDLKKEAPKKAEPVKKSQEPVEIKILKGWDYKLMEGLSKHCKLSGSAIIRFETEEGDKATLAIKRSQRWENVTDWLRKDAKLRIRVLNN